MRKFTKAEMKSLIKAQIEKEDAKITDTERDAFLQEIQEYLKDDDYYWVKGCIWKVLKYMVTHPPKGEHKRAAIRWLRNEVANITKKDFQQ